MILRKHTIRVVMAIMGAALCGILYLQYRLLSNNVALKEESFGHNVTAALDEVSGRLEEADLRDRFFASAADSGPVVLRMKKRGLPGGRHLADSTVVVSVVTTADGALNTRIQRDTLTYTTHDPQALTIRIYDELGKLDTTILDARVPAGTHELPLPKDAGAASIRFVQIRGEHATSTMRWDTRGGYRYRIDTDEEARAAKIIGRVAESAAGAGQPPLSARLRPGLVDSVLREALAGNGIDLGCEYAVREAVSDSIVLASAGFDRIPGIPEPHYAALLFPAGLAGDPGELLVWFPGYGAHLARSILPELLLNVFFLIVVGACFWYALRTLREQRDFAGRLSDFINNMTHEFKTPLATIALSTEALARSDVAADPAKTGMYGGIIAEEQRRMKSQVDRILEMAALEEGDIEFRREPVDLHEIASRAASNASMRVSERGGTVSADLRAVRHMVTGDPVHIENVVNSVLDNAEKYSPGAPEVRVSTYNAEGFIVLSIADRGIGIASEHLPKIFEKYYRVPTRNLHDVKGFGLGLSYVNLVVGRHGGSVHASSVPGSGTTIEIRLKADDDR